MGNKFKTKKGQLLFKPGQPMQLLPEGQTLEVTLKSHQKALMDAVGPSMREYLNTVKKLLDGKYANIKDYAPRHLRDPGTVMCCCCPDGIIIRYDTKTDQESFLAAGWCDETLSQIVPKISESVVYCHPNKDFTSLIPQNGPEIVLSKVDGKTGQESVISRAKVGFDVVIQPISEAIPKAPSKPYCIISVRNSFELNIVGILQPVEYGTNKERKFLLRNEMRLPIGWECIEVFPFPDIVQWKPEYASIWAENDLLASVVANQFRDRQLSNLDPNAAARTEFAKLLAEYKQLLDSDPEREEILQSFLKEHPLLLCPAHIRIKPKLPIGKNVTDFVFQEANRDYLLVELEPSTDPLFIKSGDTSSQLNHARNQIVDWRRYIEDNLHTVQKELDLPGISANPRGLVVIGRSHSLNDDNRRKLVSIENDSPKTKIMTYDDVFANAKAIVENLLGPLWLGIGTTEVYYLPD